MAFDQPNLFCLDRLPALPTAVAQDLPAECGPWNPSQCVTTYTRLAGSMKLPDPAKAPRTAAKIGALIQWILKTKAQLGLYAAAKITYVLNGG